MEKIREFIENNNSLVFWIVLILALIGLITIFTWVF